MQESTVMVGDCRLEVSRLGSGAPLVVLPGEDDVLFAGPFLEALGRSHEVHVPHHPGWAGSSRSPYVRTVRDLALVQQEYLESFGRPVPLVGLSLGGWVAAEIASTCPSLVSALVLVSPTGIKVGGREDRDFADLYVTDPARRRDVFYAPGAAPAVQERNGADVYLEIAKAEEGVARFCWQPYMHDPGLRHRLRRISAPTLLLSGTADSFVLNPRYYESYAGLIGSGAEHRRLAGAGHRVEEEQPDEAAGLIARFVGQTSPATAGRASG